MDKMQVWQSDEKGDDKIIAYCNGTIYRGYPKANELATAMFEVTLQNFSPKYFTSIPLHYITAINMQQGKAYITILFGGSTEHLTIGNDEKRLAVFNYFKSVLPNAPCFTDTQSKLRAGKKPLIAMCVLTLLFIWTIYIAKGMEQGSEYDVTGQHYYSAAGIVILLASLGVKNVILLFGSLLTVAIIAFIKKTKHPTVISWIMVRGN